MASKKLDAAMREVHTNVPSTVTATGKTGAAKEKMLRAVAFSKARQAGARIPAPPRNAMSQRQRAMRDRSTMGSPPMEHKDFKQGYRKC